MTDQPHIHCFTDVLCGHSYVAHARFVQLAADFGEQVRVTHHFRSTYGDVRSRIRASGKSNVEYNAMVRAAAARFDHVEVHPQLFLENTPTSSLPAHLYLCAVRLLEGERALARVGDSAFARLLSRVQLAFFRDARDVSRREQLDDLARELSIPVDEVARVIDDGRAHAELDRDACLERRYNVRMSPTIVMDDGRQVLNGNVGYRVIEANVRELLTTRPAAQSWM